MKAWVWIVLVLIALGVLILWAIDAGVLAVSP